MPTTDIYGFTHEDIEAARTVIEGALSLRLKQAREHKYSEYYYDRVEIPSGPCVQIRRNSGPFIRWQGNPSNRWHPDFALLVFVHGPRQELVTQYLRSAAPGLTFLETKESM
ncbi:MAG TPA: hypothetical protein VGY56_05195 [Verrucomicrobiae bacterium]|nr:hypothetical protein [Verrucomicrobiae bacterium]